MDYIDRRRQIIQRNNNTVTGPAPNPNLLTSNQATGTDTLSDLTGFGFGATTIDSSTEQYAQGSRSLKAVSAGASDSYAVPSTSEGGMQNGMEAGEKYTFSAYEYVPTATGLSPDHERGLMICLIYIDGAGVHVVVSDAPNALDTWQRLSLTQTLPADTTQAWFRLYNGFSTAGKTNYWDKLKLENGDLTDWVAP